MAELADRHFELAQAHVDLQKENANLKAALKEFIRGEQAKLIDGSKLGPFIESFLKRHNLKVEDF